MEIAGSTISQVKAVPSSGLIFGSTIKYANRYVAAADGFYTDSLPLFCISPPVLNCDDVVFYDFPTAGSTSMLGRQTSGLWVGESSVDTGVFYTGKYTFDTKVAITKVIYDDRTYIYQQADGEYSVATTTQEQEMDITDYSITSPETTNLDRELYGGNPLNDPNHASFRRNDPAIEKYELQYGSNSSANYGPFNLSSSDLVSVDSLVNELFRQVSLPEEVVGGEANRTTVESPNAMITDEDPWTLSTNSEFPGPEPSTLNVHISLARGFLQGGLR